MQWAKKEYLTLSFICFCVISREFFSRRRKKGFCLKKAFLKMKKKVSQKKREQQVSKQTKWAKKSSSIKPSNSYLINNRRNQIQQNLVLDTI